MATIINGEVGDWIPFTPEILWTTNFTATGYYLIIGKEVFVRTLVVLSGAPGGVTTQFIIIPPFPIDITKTLLGASTQRPVGFWQGFNSGILFYFGTAVYVSYLGGFTGLIAGAPNFLNKTSPTTWDSADEIMFEFHYTML